jgi:hypothetical protein
VGPGWRLGIFEAAGLPWKPSLHLYRRNRGMQPSKYLSLAISSALPIAVHSYELSNHPPKASARHPNHTSCLPSSPVVTATLGYVVNKMGQQQPYMYENARDSRLPHGEFDPKAVTRASWEPKPRKKKQEGPYISFNRHPE